MGILNTTPDSFSDGGLHRGIEAALEHALHLVEQGAEIIDIGGESTRPGSLPVPADEEIQRTAPVVAALRRAWDGWISIDTSKAAVAAAALGAGADVVNDVSGLRGDPEMLPLCVDAGCAVVVMHMRGEPRTMQHAPHYDDVVAEVRAFFEERLATLEAAGIRSEALCFDPGIGFGKKPEHNLALLQALGEPAPGGRPVLLGVSRKSVIGAVLGETDLSLRDWPTVAITAWARDRGVMLHRVHDAGPNVQALRMTEAVLGLRES